MIRRSAIRVALAVTLAAVGSHAEPIALVTLGDSLTQGDGDEAGGGYPPKLLERLKTDHPGSTLENLGQSGWTSDDLINTQLEPALAALRAAPAGAKKIALVWIGSNDLFGLYNWSCDEDYANDFAACERDGLRSFEANIAKILGSLHATGAKLFVAILDDQSKRPVITDEALRSASFDKFSAGDVPRMAAQLVRYNDAIREQAARQGATTVDFLHTTIFEKAATLSEDGNHPNAAGYREIARIWHEAISQ